MSKWINDDAYVPAVSLNFVSNVLVIFITKKNNLQFTFVSLWYILSHFVIYLLE